MLQIFLYLLVILVLVKPLGYYMAQVYQAQPCGLNRILFPIENFIYYMASINPNEEMNWKQYLRAMLIFNLLGLLAVYFLQRVQFYLPLNPEHFSAIASDLSFNTAVSFTSNTNWQAYAGENSLSYLTQMLGLSVQNFLSAATGMALLIAFIRGLARQETDNLGNFWADTVRGVLYILLPLSLLFAIVLTSQGVIQNFKPYVKIHFNLSHTEQVIPMGPVASQLAIKQLGSNGGGFFNTNSAHPFENPTLMTSFLEMLAILLIPAALCYSFGLMVNDKRQAWAILIAMLFLLVVSLFITLHFEQQGNPAFAQMNIQGGNMEGKETRFGIVDSTLWAVLTTATANGSVNAMHDSLTSLASLVLLWLMHLGEVVFGGVGCGLYGMLILVIITVFIAGLMVGRTPEYLGKKIEPFEMKMASFAILIMPLVVLIFTAIAAVTPMGTTSISNSGAHGLSEMLYAFTSMVNNNGSAFAGLNANTLFYNMMGGVGMLIGRYGIAIPILAIAGSIAKKKIIPSSSGKLATHTPLFIILLVCVILVLGALSFFPVLSLGPIAEYLK